MARALGEYDVRGIKTTIPFFRWLLADPDFRAGRFDTSFIDHALARRNGQPFQEVPPEDEHLAIVAAAVHAMTQRTSAAAPAAPAALDSRWKRHAREQGLR
jgi:acetyl/propionyl-CoA carboxylase alpha subunit